MYIEIDIRFQIIIFVIKYIKIFNLIVHLALIRYLQ